MIYHVLLIIVILSNFHERVKGHFLNTNSAKNKKYLIEIIKALNDVPKYSVGDDNNIESKDNSDELSDSEKERKLQEIIRLLKRNYNGRKHHEELINTPLHSGARLYFIKNPGVLNEYKKYLKRKKVLTLTSEEVDINEDEDNHKNWNELKRRTEFRTASTELSDNDFDRAESQEYKEQINERSDEGTQGPQSDYVQDKQSVNADDALVRKPPRKNDFKEVIKEIKSKVHDETKGDSSEVHKIRAQNEKSDNNLVRREKIEWSESDDKIDRDVSKKNDDIEKPYKVTKKKQKRFDNRKEKRVNDEPTTERELQYKAKPKINYRKPKSEVKKDYFSYGRTSIPFIGKKGIYEDK